MQGGENDAPLLWKHELYLKKKKLTENGPWLRTLEVPPTRTLFETVWAEDIPTPLRVPRADPENEANPPTAPVWAT